MSTALILEGGAMRGIFPAGVLKAFADHGYGNFDLYIGVSAGACNLTSFLTGNHDRNFGGYTQLMSQKRFISWKNIFRRTYLMDLDWLWQHLNNNFPIDETLINNYFDKFYIVVTNTKTGKAEYISPDSKNIHDVLLASSAIPIAYRKFIKLNGNTYTDGGVSDPIPVNFAIKEGADNILIIRTRPMNYKSTSDFTENIWSWLLNKHSNLQRTFKDQNNIYNNTIDLLNNIPKNIQIEQICPDVDMKTTRTSRNINHLIEDYKKGYQKGVEYIKKRLDERT